MSKTFNLGHGSTWPGHIALNLNRNFIKDLVKSNPHLKIVLVAGTNGKTTTSKLIQFILEKNGKKVFHNEAGANLLNGIASTLIQRSNRVGRIDYDTAIFEVDENTLPLALGEITPYAIIILNLFRDQLDRYGEVNTIAKRWNDALLRLQRSLLEYSKGATLQKENTLLFINGDDPQLTFIGQQSGLKTYYFGIDKSQMKKRKIPHDVDFLYCPKCKHKLTFMRLSYSHLGEFKCDQCEFKNQETFTPNDLKNPLLGIYNVYNINAAALVAQKAFDIPVSSIKSILAEFKPAFGRQEEFDIDGKKVMVLLSKNPTGFNQSIEAILTRSILAQGVSLHKKPTILLVLNDKIPDGRDVSWIWDVDFEKLVKNSSKIVISGERCYDMGLRMKYTLPRHSELVSESRSRNKFGMTFQIEENLKEAINHAIKLTNENETLFILPTYSAMLEVRKILTGRKIL